MVTREQVEALKRQIAAQHTLDDDQHYETVTNMVIEYLSDELPLWAIAGIEAMSHRVNEHLNPAEVNAITYRWIEMFKQCKRKQGV